jgi:hypothetical protein
LPGRRKMRGKTKPAGKEKWSWEVINQGRRFTPAERADRWAAKHVKHSRANLISSIRESGVEGPLSPEELADILSTIKFKATIVVGKQS